MSFFYPHTATIKQYGGVTQNNEGTLIPSSLTTYRTGVPCDLQISSSVSYDSMEYGETGVQYTHIVFMKPDTNVKRKNKVVINGVQYEIVGIEPYSTHYELNVVEEVN